MFALQNFKPCQLLSCLFIDNTCIDLADQVTCVVSLVYLNAKENKVCVIIIVRGETSLILIRRFF